MSMIFERSLDDRVVDLLWDGVEAARAEGWTLERCTEQVRQAWVESCRQEMERAKAS